MKHLFLYLSLNLLISCIAYAEEKNNSNYEAVVRIENSSLNPDYKTPWNSGRDSGGNGTGWLVAENKFLTNAHVVSNSRIVYIKKVGDAKPYRARIVHIAHDCDLAMLELEDPAVLNLSMLEHCPNLIPQLKSLATQLEVKEFQLHLE